MACALLVGGVSLAGEPTRTAPPGSESFGYNIEWRMVRAGFAQINVEKNADSESISKIHLRVTSGGLVARLFRVQDSYAAAYDAAFCTTAVNMASEEGRRKRETEIRIDRGSNRARYTERDPQKNALREHSEISILPCARDCDWDVVRRSRRPPGGGPFDPTTGYRR
jgi:hypothetical protein